MKRGRLRAGRSERERVGAAALRRRRLRQAFDVRVGREWQRYSGDAWRVLARELRERFVRLHLGKGRGWVLELGPGPGRFTPTILSSKGTVVAVDFSLPMLRALDRRKSLRRGRARLRSVRAAGEHLPFRDGAFRATVALGNLLGFSASDGARLLAEIARVTKPGGLLILDVASPVGAATDFLELTAKHRDLLRVLRRPGYYFLTEVVRDADRTHQPYAPKRWGNWEFDFYTPAGADQVLRSAGFRRVDRMAIAPIGAYRDRLTRSARRDPRAWKTLLAFEEHVGRRAGTLETGHGFVIAALRLPHRRRRPRARPQVSNRPPRSRAAHVLSRSPAGRRPDSPSAARPRPRERSH
ncbi:MAG TPA: class I SAM-dependent methyltransferase [Thermoplasmata archaeon]|nr:class I SAM-dependent methyltransferase [Thermoplasmata archaeon]